jgi:hypothetical protein
MLLDVNWENTQYATSNIAGRKRENIRYSTSHVSGRKSGKYLIPSYFAVHILGKYPICNQQYCW